MSVSDCNKKDKDNMEAIFLLDSKQKLSLNDGQLEVSLSGKVQESYPLVPLKRVIVYGNPQITTQAIKACLEEGISLQYYTVYGKYLGMITPTQNKNRERRLQQYRLATDSAQSLKWSKSLIRAKIKSYEIEYRRVTDNGWHVRDKRFLRELRTYAGKIEGTQDQDALRGIEGTCAKRWFGFWGESLPPGWDWHGRSYHPPLNEVNAALSLLYGLFSREIDLECRRHGLDPEISFMHRNGYGSGGLASDVVELFRAAPCEHTVLKLLHHGKLDVNDFSKETSRYRMSGTGWEKLRKHFEEKLYPSCRQQVIGLLEHVLQALSAQREPFFETFLPVR